MYLCKTIYRIGRFAIDNNKNLISMKQSDFFLMPYFNGVRPKEFRKETKEFYTKKALVFGVKMSFNKNFEKSKQKI